MMKQNEPQDTIDAVERHYAQFLGQPSALYVIPLPAHPDGHYHIAEYEDVPCEGAVTLATIGFSMVPLHMFRQEFLFCCYRKFITPELIKLIAAIAEMITDSQHPLLRGDILPPAGSLLGTTKMEAIYTGALLYFNTDADAFDTLEVGGLDVGICWLLPIHSTEVDWIQGHGVEAFEDLLIEINPDALDLTRPSII